MDFVIGEGRKFSICHLKIRTYSLHHTPFVTLWGHYSFGLLSTHSHHPSLNSFGESLSAAREDPRGASSPWTRPLYWSTGKSRPPLGLSDDSSHTGSRRVDRSWAKDDSSFCFCFLDVHTFFWIDFYFFHKHFLLKQLLYYPFFLLTLWIWAGILWAIKLKNSIRGLNIQHPGCSISSKEHSSLSCR